MDNIKDVIGKVIGNLSSRDFSGQDKLAIFWNKVIDPKDLNHTKIIGLKNNKLYIAVDSSAWMFHLRSKKESILSRLSEDMHDVKDIIFRIGKIT
jgi:predicted nucleic acid-binding Zn ribbon protein